MGISPSSNKINMLSQGHDLFCISATWSKILARGLVPRELKFWLWNAKFFISWNSIVVWPKSSSYPQRLCTFWSAWRTPTSYRTRFSEHVQRYRKSLIHRLSVKSGKSDGLRMLNKIIDMYMLRKLSLARGCDTWWW